MLSEAGVVIALLTGVSGLLTLGTGSARADVSTGGLAVGGDSIVTDDGRLTSLTVTLSGHVSYDGLDAEATTVDVGVYAAPAGGAVDATRNRIGTVTAAVATTTGLHTNAGHYDYTFQDVDVLAADDLSAQDFAATPDGATAQTDVDVRVGLVVSDATGSVLAEASDVTTTTVTVENQAHSSGSSGSGQLQAGGQNQSP